MNEAETAVQQVAEEQIRRAKGPWFQRLDPAVKQQLFQVYIILAATVLCSTIGCLLQVNEQLDLGLLAAIASLVFVVCLHTCRDEPQNYYLRLTMLMSFGFFSGQTLGTLVSLIAQDNAIVITESLAGAAVTFLSLSLAALVGDGNKYLFLGAILYSISNAMAIMSLCNVIFRFGILKSAEMYVGVAVVAGFIVYDTQNLVEKSRAGSCDVIRHALDLFFDFLSIFRRLLNLINLKL